MKAIRARGLTKDFGSVTAVNGIDFEVEEGEFFGFLGPNGAGKTTTINMMTGLARLTKGELQVLGFAYPREMKKAQAEIGVVPDESNLYDEMTGLDNLVFAASLYGEIPSRSRARAQELLELVGLEEAAGRKFKGYSRGMKRRLTIAAALMHRPRLLFLDEPTSGIDVASARQIRRFIADLNAEGTTVFLTTHYIEEAERLTHRIAFIVDGRIVRSDLTQNLLQEAGSHDWVAFTLENGRTGALEAVRLAFPDLESIPSGENQIRVRLPREGDIYPVMTALHQAGHRAQEARIIRPSLEEVFVRVTGIEAQQMAGEKRGGNR